jgi:hypothetical protein
MTKSPSISRRAARNMTVDRPAAGMPGATIGRLTRDHALWWNPEIMCVAARVISRNCTSCQSDRMAPTAQRSAAYFPHRHFPAPAASSF